MSVVLIIIAVLLIALVSTGVRMVQQYQRGSCCDSAGCCPRSVSRVCGCWSRWPTGW